MRLSTVLISVSYFIVTMFIHFLCGAVCLFTSLLSLLCGPVCVCVTSITCLSVCGFLFLQVKCLREVIVHTCVCFIFACILFTIFTYLFIFVFMFILLIKIISDYHDS